MKNEKREFRMFRFLVYLAFAWLGWKALKIIFRIMSGADSLKQKREYGTVQGDGEKQQMEFKDVQDAEFTEVKDREPASK
jgi:hypothetical protein